MTRIPYSLRRRVVKRANGLCEYCQTQQIVVVAMTVDHIVPVSAGGSTELDNLCLACGSCNTRKYHFQRGFDSVTGREWPLYNPRVQVWSQHFAWSENGIILTGLTAVGRATIDRLRINRREMMSARQVWIRGGLHPPETGL